jgi:hypothetical protein
MAGFFIAVKAQKKKNWFLSRWMDLIDVECHNNISNERNKTNKMHKLMRGLIYYCSITPTCFGPLVEAIIR